MRQRFLTFLNVVSLLTFGAALHAHDGDGKSLGNAAPAGSGGSGPFSAWNVHLKSHLELNQIGGGGSVIGSDLWGWTDSASGRQFALVGLTNATSFIEVTDPDNPVYLGKLDTHEAGQNRAWRDIKVFNDHAFIVADGSGNDQGMQIYDLTQLVAPNPSFVETGHYDGFSSAHNIVINEDTGFAYLVGQPRSGPTAGGLMALDLNDLANITVAGIFSADGYTHDAQAVIYHGPDTAHVGKELVFAANEDSLTIIDVSDKTNMTQISKRLYANSAYAHQGWLSEDHKFFFMDDELDERNNANTGNPPFPTRTIIWNVQDLDNPEYVGFYEGVEKTIDHNIYVKDNLIFQANYTAGMRVLKMVDPANGVLQEVGFFDSYMADNNISFNGAWSVFPFFDDGTILISDRQGGLFVVEMLPEPSALGRFYSDFDSIIPAPTGDPIGDGWRFFNTNEPDFDYFGQTPNGPQISALADDGAGNQYLHVFADYDNPNLATHALTLDVFQEQTFTAADAALGATWNFRFDYAKADDPFGVGGATATGAFIRVLDGSLNLLDEAVFDTTGATGPAFAPGSVSLTFDPAWSAGGIVQFGFTSTVIGTDPSGVYYDNANFCVLGDANDDDALDNLDISASAQALNMPAAYAAAHPDLDPDVVLDMNHDGVFNNADIGSFGAALGF